MRRGHGGSICSGTMHRVHVTRYGDFLYLAWRDGRLPQRLNLNTGVVVLVGLHIQTCVSLAEALLQKAFSAAVGG